MGGESRPRGANVMLTQAQLEAAIIGYYWDRCFYEILTGRPQSVQPASRVTIQALRTYREILGQLAVLGHVPLPARLPLPRESHR